MGGREEVGGPVAEKDGVKGEEGGGGGGGVI